MSLGVCHGATLQCSFGVAPSVLSVIPTSAVFANSMPMATIMDNKPILNIALFAMCTSPSNPQVAAATAAALGVLTPMPCMPVISVPWSPGSPTVQVANMPALSNNSRCLCNWGGMISIIQPAQTTVMIP